jgi:formylglycine-generating enzyme required for sulfatase activity
MADGDEEDPEVSYSRSVSGFYLDRFEVTVGRLAAFATEFALPAAGQGRHPRVEGSGWQVAWEEIAHPAIDGKTIVPATKEELLAQVSDQCAGGTWLANDQTLPASCVNWYVAFAFCAYDGGRLPTEAEWNFAAAAGSEQRPYPWSASKTDASIDGENATFYDYPVLPMLPTAVGSHASGRGALFRFENRGHDDLAGNVFEWMLDQWVDPPSDGCGLDCLPSWTDEDRVVRGGGFDSDYSFLRAGSRSALAASAIEPNRGFRCARDIETGSE